MRYILLELSGYKPFLGVAKIKKIVLRFTSDVQLILGTNGSGKSSLLRECSPLPATSTDYEPDGCKRLILEHRGVEYVLTSDFAKKGSAHSFRRNGHELNEGGTTQVQEDLVRTHLGYTSLVESIINMQEHLTKLAPAARKTLLMTVSPCSMEYAFETHKKVLSRIRAIKNTLTHLNERKVAVKGEMLDAQLLEQLRQESATLNSQVAHTVGYIHRIDEQLRMRPERQVFGLTIAEALAAAKEELQRAHGAFANAHSVPREGRDAYRERLAQEITATQSSRRTLSEKAAEHAHDIAVYSAQLESLTSEEVVRKTEAEIGVAQAEMERLAKNLTDSPFHPSYMAELPDLLERIQDLVAHFLSCQVPLLGSATITRKRQQLQQRRSELMMLERQATQLEEAIDRLRKRLPLKMSDLPEDMCAKARCPLYVRFRNAHDSTEEEIAGHTRQLRLISHKLSRLRPYVETAHERIQALSYYLPQLYELFELLQQYPHLRAPLQGLHVLQTLQSNPVVIYERLRHHYEQSAAVYRHRDLEAAVAERLTALAQAANSEERRMLEEILERTRSRHADTMAQIAGEDLRLETLNREYSRTVAFDSAVKKLTTRLTDLRRLQEDEEAVTETKALKAMRALLDEFRQTSVSRLGVIDRTLLDQQKLESRLSEEVLQQIAILEAELAELVLVEEALAGIPHGYMCDFLNALIATMNYYIRQVFSYVYEISPVNVDKALDYNFQVKMGDTTIRDVKVGSSAQKEIVDLAFMLALVRHLGLSDYPIYLDEIGKSFDPHHKHRLLNLLRLLTEQKLVSQMFVINHHAEVHEGLANAEVLVLNPSNILVPASYNLHAEIER